MRHLLALLLFLPATACASAIVESSEGALLLRAPLGDDTYVAGEWVTLPKDLPLSGDLFGVGKTLDIHGRVTQDFTAAGMTLTMDGTVGDDMRAAGKSVTISGTVGDDLIAFGETVTIGSDAVIGGDVVAFAQNVQILGTVRGSVTIYASETSISGPVGGALSIEGDQISLNGKVGASASLTSENIMIGPEALIGGNVTYSGPLEDIDFGDAVKGTITKTAIPVPPDFTVPEDNFALRIRKALSIPALLTGAATILFFLLLTTRSFGNAAKVVQKKPLQSFLLGLLLILGLPIVSLLLLVTIIGWPLAVYGLLVFLIILIFAKALTALTAAKWVEAQWGKSWSKWMTFLAAILAFAVLRLLPLIPMVGWVLQWIFILTALGALLMVKKDLLKKYG